MNRSHRCILVDEKCGFFGLPLYYYMFVYDLEEGPGWTKLVLNGLAVCDKYIYID